MNKSLRYSLVLLRISLGWLFFYAGITKVFDSSWSAAGYLQSAKTFSGVYQWLASASNIGWINFVNEWSLVLIGAALIVGFRTRIAALLGAGLMLLYYFPILDFPYVGEHSLLVDEHIIYIFSLLILARMRAGEYWGLDSRMRH
ncbi:MAG: DoxX family membrane protein [Patescibacteria group bacterium]